MNSVSCETRRGRIHRGKNGDGRFALHPTSAICRTGRVAGGSSRLCSAAGKAAAMTGKIAIGASDVLVVVDVQI
jgi:membrane protein involved in colicin uptake